MQNANTTTFTKAYELTNIVDKPTSICGKFGHYTKLLCLIITRTFRITSKCIWRQYQRLREHHKRSRYPEIGKWALHWPSYAQWHQLMPQELVQDGENREWQSKIKEWEHKGWQIAMSIKSKTWNQWKLASVQYLESRNVGEMEIFTGKPEFTE